MHTQCFASINWILHTGVSSILLGAISICHNPLFFKVKLITCSSTWWTSFKICIALYLYQVWIDIRIHSEQAQYFTKFHIKYFIIFKITGIHSNLCLLDVRCSAAVTNAKKVRWISEIYPDVVACTTTVTDLNMYIPKLLDVLCWYGMA